MSLQPPWAAGEMAMEINIVDVLFLVPADLPAGDRGIVQRDLQDLDGVLSVQFVPNRPRMLKVAYNPKTVTSKALRNHMSKRGLTVGMVGM
jgi:hypothetical protein